MRLLKGRSHGPVDAAPASCGGRHEWTPVALAAARSTLTTCGANPSGGRPLAPGEYNLLFFLAKVNGRLPLTPL